MMGFMIHSTDDGRVPATEYLPAGAITPKAGMALNQADGLLAAAGAGAPSYICMADRADACGAGEYIPVVRVSGDIIFETAFTADAGTVKLGDKVAISADGLGVTGVTEGGAAEVVYMDGTEAGSMCRVRFH